MPNHAYVAIVTLLAAALFFWMGLEVAGARRKTGVAAPAMTGDPLLERTVRAHYNTMEWMPIFLPAMWIFAIYWSDLVAAGLGVVWILGRIVYHRGYVAAAEKRSIGFLIQFVAAAVLLVGGLGRLVYVVFLTQTPGA